MNTPVSFELAKLLKEKGFDTPCINYYTLSNEFTPKDYLFTGKADNYNNVKNSVHNNNGTISAPTIAEVVMWLYEKHRIWVVVDNLIDNKFYFSHRDTKTNNYASRSGCNEEGYESPTEAYEAGIRYVLSNLI